MQSQGKNIRRLTRPQDDCKAAPNPRFDAHSSEISTFYSSQSPNGTADWASVDGPLGFDILLQVTDEPESDMMTAPWELSMLLPSILSSTQPQEHHMVYDPMPFAQDLTAGSWVPTSTPDYSAAMNMEDIQPSVSFIHHYPSPTLSPSWRPFSDFSSTPSPAPVPQFISNHVSAVPAHGSTPCADQVYDNHLAHLLLTFPQNHSSAETVPSSPVSPCPPTKPRPTSAVRKTPSRSKKANGRIHMCPECPKTFSRPYNLSSHIKTHSGMKPHACNYDGCKSTFLRPYDLARHERNHNGQKPFVCSGCNEPFKRHEGLKRHEKSCL
ncbi:unnamed protein product [Mortierella alpina]